MVRLSNILVEHIIIGYYPYVVIFFKVILVIQILEVSDIIFVKKTIKYVIFNIVVNICQISIFLSFKEEIRFIFNRLLRICQIYIKCVIFHKLIKIQNYFSGICRSTCTLFIVRHLIAQKTIYILL